MAAQPHSGTLILADISGFTSYVAQTELTHSQEILSELLELIVRHTRPVLTVSKLEGDAVFAYETGKHALSGERLLEVIESTYMAFRGRVDGIKARTTCTCNACIRIPMLDLKFFTHYGEFMIQTISGTNELVGSDVNLIHRLAKNHVFEETGWNAYALYTDRVIEQMRLPVEGMHPLVETYDHLGDIQTYSSDLRTRYEEIITTRRIRIEPEDGHMVIKTVVHAPPAVVWEWLTEPEKRNLWQPNIIWSATGRLGGRNGVGATNHCAHGEESTYETILDWQPFDYYTTEMKHDLDKPIWKDLKETVQLRPLEDGGITELTDVYQLQNPSLKGRLFMPLMKKMIKGMIDTMDGLIQESTADSEPAAADP